MSQWWGGKGVKGDSSDKGKGKGGGKDDTAQDMAKLKEIPSEQKVWIGSLPPGTNWKQLQMHFNSVGRSIYVAVFEKSNTGCVAFKTAHEVQQAVSQLNGSMLGPGVIQVDYFTASDKPKKGGFKGGWRKGKGKGDDATNLVYQLISKLGGGGFGGKGKGKGKSKGAGEIKKLKSIDPSQKVWVGGLNKSVTWKQLEEHFNQVAKTTWASTFGSTGCVAYSNADEATSAIAMLNGSVLGDCVLQVDVFTSRK